MLWLIFGITNSVCALFLRFATRILVKVLLKSDLARVCMTTNEEIEIYQKIIQSNFSMLGSVYEVADGLKLMQQQSRDCVIQEMF